jgi:hypothetical protein
METAASHKRETALLKCVICFGAFSSREPEATSLEDAMKHDIA